MKRLSILVAALWLSFGSLSAQQWVSASSSLPVERKTELQYSDIERTVVNFKVGGYFEKIVSTPKGNAIVPNIAGAARMLTEGVPDLLSLTTSLIIPDEAEMAVRIVDSEYIEFENIEIAPSKGNLKRNVNPDDVPYVYGKVYQQNKMFPGVIAELREPYILRDYRGQTLVIYPLQYNPVTKKLRVYTNISVEVVKNADAGKNALVRTKPLKSIQKDFAHIYDRHFLNSASATRYTPVEEGGNMLIISYGAFIPYVQEFAQWKQTIGIPTEIVDVSTIGNAAAIKTYVQNYYDTHGLTYLLLVGDNAQVPSNTISYYASDNSYGYVAGNDKNPDVFVGRFSAETVDHVITQVERTLNYEKADNISNGWLSKGVGIASDEGPGDNGEMDWEHVRIIRNQLLGFTYDAVAELYEGSQGGEDAPGDPNSSMLATLLNAGAGIINYTGHGSSTSFQTTGFSNSDVNNLTNTGKLPFIWSVACVNGDFTNGTCFAEVWMRATHNGEPTGSVANLMSTINQSWDPPMRGQDEMVDILVESYTHNIKRTFGGISMNGCIHMNEVYGSAGEEMTDTWNLFGDPSLMVRTKDPEAMVVNHPQTIVIGSNQMQITCDVEDAFVVLTIDGEIIGTGTINGGSVIVSFDALTNIDSIKVAVTAFNYIPYIGDVLIIAPSGPYVIFKSHTINDSQANNNGIPDFGETIKLHIELQNVGPDLANGVTAILSSENSYVNITDSTQNFGNIAGQNTASENDAFTFAVANNVPDNHPVLFKIKTSDNQQNNWTSSFIIRMRAPVPTIGQFIIDDSNGNNNGLLDPGENIIISIISLNNGGSDCVFSGQLASSSPYVTISNQTYDLATIPAGSLKTAIFNVSLSPDAPTGTVADFHYNLTSVPANYSAEKTFYEKIGLIIENWETGNFSKFSWQHSGTAPWFVQQGGQYEGDYCLASGTITHNQSSVLSVQMDVLANDSISFYWKVSCEQNTWGGDPWDYLEFIINNGSKAKWDGITNWARAAFPVTAGTRTFKWQYVKDGYMTEGADRAWIDYIVFPPIATSASIEKVYVDIPVYMQVFPNPATESINIGFSLNDNSEVNALILNTMGQEVYRTPMQSFSSGNHNIEIPLGTLSSGMYFVKLNAGEHSITRRIVLGG